MAGSPTILLQKWKVIIVTTSVPWFGNFMSCSIYPLGCVILSSLSACLAVCWTWHKLVESTGTGTGTRWSLADDRRAGARVRTARQIDGVLSCRSRPRRCRTGAGSLPYGFTYSRAAWPARIARIRIQSVGLGHRLLTMWHVRTYVRTRRNGIEAPRQQLPAGLTCRFWWWPQHVWIGSADTEIERSQSSAGQQEPQGNFPGVFVFISLRFRRAIGATIYKKPSIDNDIVAR